MRFVKWHGLGNDYLFTRSAIGSLEDATQLARALSDRRRGRSQNAKTWLEESVVDSRRRQSPERALKK